MLAWPRMTFDHWVLTGDSGRGQDTDSRRLNTDSIFAISFYAFILKPKIIASGKLFNFIFKKMTLVFLQL